MYEQAAYDALHGGGFDKDIMADPVARRQFMEAFAALNQSGLDQAQQSSRQQMAMATQPRAGIKQGYSYADGNVQPQASGSVKLDAYGNVAEATGSAVEDNPIGSFRGNAGGQYLGRPQAPNFGVQGGGNFQAPAQPRPVTQRPAPNNTQPAQTTQPAPVGGMPIGGNFTDWMSQVADTFPGGMGESPVSRVGGGNKVGVNDADNFSFAPMPEPSPQVSQRQLGNAPFGRPPPKRNVNYGR